MDVWWVGYIGEVAPETHYQRFSAGVFPVQGERDLSGFFTQ